MFAGKTHNLPRIRTYADAHSYFESTKLPPRSKKWGHNQRPLKDSRAYHYRIERSGGDLALYYDLVLYNTVMARLHKPSPMGEEMREYIWHSSQTSKSFMWDVCRRGWCDTEVTTDGRRVVAPIMYKPLGVRHFSAQLMYNSKGLLITDSSRHVEIGRHVASSDDRAQRAAIKKAFEPMLTLAALRLPAFAENVYFEEHTAGPFRGFPVRRETRVAVNELCKALLEGAAPHPTDVEYFMALAQDVFDKIASDRADDKGLLGWRAGSFQPLPQYHEIEPITEQQLVRSLWNKLLQLLPVGSTRGFAPYPQFPDVDTFVASNVHCATY